MNKHIDTELEELIAIHKADWITKLAAEYDENSPEVIRFKELQPIIRDRYLPIMQQLAKADMLTLYVAGVHLDVSHVFDNGNIWLKAGFVTGRNRGTKDLAGLLEQQLKLDD